MKNDYWLFQNELSKNSTKTWIFRFSTRWETFLENLILFITSSIYWPINERTIMNNIKYVFSESAINKDEVWGSKSIAAMVTISTFENT